MGYVIVDKQVFILIDWQRLKNAEAYLKQLPLDGSCEVEFRPKKKSRTNKQNAALWAVAYPPIMESMGLRGEKERLEIHEYFCGEYFGWKEYMILDKKKVRPVRTTTTDEDGKKNNIETAVMADFYNFIQQRAADNGIYVQDPDPMYGISR